MKMEGKNDHSSDTSSAITSLSSSTDADDDHIDYRNHFEDVAVQDYL